MTRNISWVFDVISPFAYLAFKRLPEDLEIRLVPVLFAGLLDHHGQIGPAEIPSKRRFTYRFTLWRARKMGVTLRLPPAHPFNPLSALRLIVAAGSTRKATEAVFDAVFAHGRDVSAPDVIADLASQIGLANSEAASNAPDVKRQLRANTDWALSRGVFGVPTLVIDDEIFWGVDAMDMALDFLREPRIFDDSEMRAIESLPVGARRRGR